MAGAPRPPAWAAWPDERDVATSALMNIAYSKLTTEQAGQVQLLLPRSKNGEKINAGELGSLGGHRVAVSRDQTGSKRRRPG